MEIVKLGIFAQAPLIPLLPPPTPLDISVMLAIIVWLAPPSNANVLLACSRMKQEPLLVKTVLRGNTVLPKE